MLSRKRKIATEESFAGENMKALTSFVGVALLAAGLMAAVPSTADAQRRGGGGGWGIGVGPGGVYGGYGNYGNYPGGYYGGNRYNDGRYYGNNFGYYPGNRVYRDSYYYPQDGFDSIALGMSNEEVNRIFGGPP